MKINTNDLLLWFVLVFLLLLNLQMLGVNGWLEGNQSGLKVYQLFLVVFVPLFVRVNPLAKRGFILVYLFMLIVLMSSAWFLYYGFNTMLFNYLLAFYLFFLGTILARNFSEQKLLRTFQIAVAIINLVILIKLIAHYDRIVSFFSFRTGGHPYIYYIYGGGANLEATWVATNTLFFVNRKKLFYLFWVFSLLLGAIYASRVGIILALTVYLIYFFSNRATKTERKVVFGVVIASLIFFGYYVAKNISQIYVVERFMKLGDSSELGSQGRLRIWSSYFESFDILNILGVGPGNAIPSIESKLGTEIRENNVHNYYLQVLLDFGLLGLVIFLLMVWDVVHKNIRNKFHNPFGVFVLCYLIVCMIQFRGAENFVWLVYGIFLSNYYNPLPKFR